jgi:2,5-furandicarboxylate decarboxylase 1
MQATFRGWLQDLETKGELVRVRREVDARHISALTAQAPGAVLLERIRGFEFGVVAGLVRNRRQIALTLGCPEGEVGKALARGLERPLPPRLVSTAPVKEVVLAGEDVDLTRFPIPLLHTKDGGPYLSGGVVVARDPAGVRNAGMYRMMFRTRCETGIDLASHSDLRRLYRGALQADRPLPIAVALGTHLVEMLAAGYQAPPGVDEFAVAGGLRGEPVDLVRAETVDLEVPADAEIVLEGEILPVGWTADEGRFGDVYWVMGDLKRNPVFRVKAITHRRDAILYCLHMPWENVWLGRAMTEAAAWKILQDVRVQVTAVRAGFGVVVAAIRKNSGEGKNALLALLAQGVTKIAIVTDDDVDIFDREELEWAMAFRVQAGRDVLVIPGARGKHLDPSVRAWELKPGELPMTDKLGIDATIPEGIPGAKYERMAYPYAGRVRLGDYLEG